MSEFSLINKIKKWIPLALQGAVPIGDDAAFFKLPFGEGAVFTTDTIVDGVDFYADPRKKSSPGYLSAYWVGRKVLAINLSDIAAMGAKPLACVISLGIPEQWKERWLREFYQGMVHLAQEFNVKCCGGDITKSDKFFATVSMVGNASKKNLVTRNGAKPGDLIAVTGSLGGSLLTKHASFMPRILEASFLAKQFKPSAMMDISDGFLQDLGHLLKASQMGACLEMLEIPISPHAVFLAKKNPLKAFERACTDGEDFELLFTIPPHKRAVLEKAWKRRFPQVSLSWIGQITKRPEKITWFLGGERTTAPAFKGKGYQHF